LAKFYQGIDANRLWKPNDYALAIGGS
jgi:hypothetical protein